MLWLCRLAVVLAVALAYYNSFGGPFFLDDAGSIQNNSTIHRLWDIRAVLSPPSGGETVAGRPLLNLSLAVNWAICGNDPFGYHVGNLLIHMLAALVLFGLVRRVLMLPWAAGGLGCYATPLALASAICWGVHPITTGAVTYIIQRAESLMALLYLATLYCSVRVMSGPSTRTWTIAAVACAFAGMAAKEVMVTAPVVVLLLDRLLVSKSFMQALRQRWSLYAGLAASWLLLGAELLGSHARGGSAAVGMDNTSYLLTQSRSVCDYIGRTFWPNQQVLLRSDLVQGAGEVWPYLAILLIMTVVAVWALRRWPAVSLLLLSAFITLLPSSSVVALAFISEMEHRCYLASAAWVCLAVGLGGACYVRLRRRLSAGGRPAPWLGAIPLVLTVAIVGTLAYRTHARNTDYRTEKDLWAKTYRQAPGYFACASLATSYQRSGQISEAIKLLTEGLDRFHVPRLAYYRGSLYLRSQCYDQAIDDLSLAIKNEPDVADSYVQRAAAYSGLKQYKQAMIDVDKALALKADFPEAMNNRADTLMQTGQTAQALIQCNKLLDGYPSFAIGYLTRAQVQMAAGNVQAARRDLDTYVRLGGPDDPGLRRQIDYVPETRPNSP